MRGQAWTVLSALVLVAFAACGKSRRSDETDATGGSAGDRTGGSGAVSNNECIIVRRLGCCMPPFLAHPSDLAADDCLVPYDHIPLADEATVRCREDPPEGCVPEPCAAAQPPPPSRVTAVDEEGRCYYADECEDVSDCTLAAQVCDCCPCSVPTPVSLVTDTCLVTENDPNPEATGAVVCPSGFCLGCRHELEVSCSPTPGGLRRCEWGPELPSDACSVERPCTGAFAGMSCFATGVPSCGGPTVPNDCAEDVDCARLGPTGICGDWCGRLYCVSGCASDGDCLSSEICATNHRCEAKPCSDDAECGKSFRCTEGLCERRTCAVTANCEGYCVRGLCYDEPGHCSVPLL